MFVDKFLLILIMILLMWLIYEDYAKKQDSSILCVLCGQFFSFILFTIFVINGVKMNNIVKFLITLFGIALPGVLLLYWSDKKKVWDFINCLKSKFIKDKKSQNNLGENVLLLNDNSKDYLDIAKDLKILPEIEAEEILRAYSWPYDEIPSSVKQSLAKTEQLLSTGSHRKILEIYLSIEKRCGENPALQYNIGNMYYYIKDYCSAVERYGNALAIISKVQSTVNGKDNKHSHKIAAMRVKNSLKKVEEYEINYNIAVCFASQGKYENAIETFNKAGDYKGNWTNIYEPLAIIYDRLKKYPEAVEMYKNYVDIVPSFEGYKKVADISCKLGMFEQARKYYDKMNELKPEYFEGYLKLGNALIENKNYSEAINVYEEVLKINSDISSVHYNLGLALYCENDKDRAIEEYKKAIMLNSNDYKAFYNLGVVLDEIGEKEEAVLVFKHCLEIKPDFYEASNNLAVILCSLELFNEAIDIYLKALQFDPYNCELYFNMAVTLELQNKIEQAEELYEKIIKMNVSFSDAYYNLSLIYIDRGEKDRAEECLRYIIDQNKNYHKAYYQLAKLYAETREYGRTLDYLRKAVSQSEEYKLLINNETVFNSIKNLKGFETVLGA